MLECPRSKILTLAATAAFLPYLKGFSTRGVCGRPGSLPPHARQRHFDVQLIGGMILHNAGIAEMRTGEGKTLVATLPAYLNALTGKRCACGHGQRLPLSPRCGVDGADLSRARHERRCSSITKHRFSTIRRTCAGKGLQRKK
jgi:hypothetical protein